MTSNFRSITFSLASIFAFRMLGLFMILPVFSLYAEHLSHANPKLIGMTLGIYGLTQACLQIPFGLLSDRFGRKPLILIGLILFIAGSVIAALSNSIYGVMLGRALQGSGAIGSVILALLADLTPVAERTKAMAIVGITIAMTFAIAIILGPVLNTFVGVRGIFWLTAGLGVLGILMLYVGIPKPASLSINPEVEPVLSLVKNVVSQVELLRLDFGIFTLHAVLTALFVMLPTLLENFLGIAERREWLVYLPVILIAFSIAIPLIAIAEKRGKLKLFLLGAILAVISAILSILFLPLNMFLISIYLTLFFAAFTLLEASLPSLISKLAPPGGKGTALGIYSSLQFFGIFVGGSVAGNLFVANNFTAVGLFCLVLLVLWFLFALGMKNPSQHSDKQMQAR